MRLLPAFLVIAALGALATPAQAQKFDEEEWQLTIDQIKIGTTRTTQLDKIRVGGVIYHYWPFKLTNPGKSTRPTQLQIYLISDKLRKGVNPADARPWNAFKNFQLPVSRSQAEPTAEFDNTDNLHKQKRFYDKKYAEALSAIQAELQKRHGISVKHTSDLGRLPAGASANGVAIFKNVDAETQYAGVVVKGLFNRVRDIKKTMFLEDEVKIYNFWTPGSPSTLLQNQVHFRLFKRYVVKREKIQYPTD